MIPQMLSLSLVLPCSTTIVISIDFLRQTDFKASESQSTQFYTLNFAKIIRTPWLQDKSCVFTATLPHQPSPLRHAAPGWPYLALFPVAVLASQSAGGHVSKEVIRSALHSLGWNLLRADRSRCRTD